MIGALSKSLRANKWEDKAILLIIIHKIIKIKNIFHF